MIATIFQFGLHQIRQIFNPRGVLLKEGAGAPDFAATDESGNTRRLSDYRGRRLVLWFFPRAETPG